MRFKEHFFHPYIYNGIYFLTNDTVRFSIKTKHLLLFSSFRHNDFPWNLRKFLQNHLKDFHFDADLTKVKVHFLLLSGYQYLPFPSVRILAEKLCSMKRV